MAAMLEMLDAEITKTECRLDELRTTRRVLLGLGPETEGIRVAPAFVGANMWEYARVVLVKCGKAHYRDIAQEALKMGYQNRRGSSPASLQRSFLDTLRRDDDEFEALGKGYFKLKRPDEAASELAEPSVPT